MSHCYIHVKNSKQLLGMDSIWNEAELKPPPFITLPVTNAKFVQQVRSIFLQRQSVRRVDSFLNKLSYSAALLSRMMARRKNSFNKMKGFKSICKLNTALGRLLKIDIEEILNNFYQSLPEMLIISEPKHQVPSRSNFDFVLLRLITVHKLYERICFCCVDSAEYFKKLLTLGFFIDTITVFMTVTANLLDVSKKIANIYTDVYNKLIPLRKCFPKANSCKRFDDVKFPAKLDHFSEQTDNTCKPSTKGQGTISLQVDSTKHSSPSSTSFLKVGVSKDVGMAISRDLLKPVIDLSKINNIEDIRQFFTKETLERDKSFKTCATKRIPKHDWLSIQKQVQRRIIGNDHKKAVSIFKKFMSDRT